MRTLHSLLPTLSLCIGLLASVSTHAATAEEVSEVNRLHQSGESTRALALADKLLAARPKDAQVRFLKGVILAETQRGAEATDIFQALTQDFPELAEPYNNLATLYAARGEYEAARTALEQALRSNPSYATAHENLGDVYSVLASRSYARALSLEPSNPPLTAKLGLVKQLLGAKRSLSAPPTQQ
jgi:Flp pilus assembly protein TadD